MTIQQLKNLILSDASKSFIDCDDIDKLEYILIHRFKDLELVGADLPEVVNDDIEKYIDIYVQLHTRKLSTKTINEYIRTTRQFFNLINKPLRDITSIDVEFFLQKSALNGCSEVTLNNYRRNLSAFFSWFVKKKYITYNPCNDIDSYKEIIKPIDHLTPEQIENLKYNNNKPEHIALIEFMRCTGVRVGELIEIKVSDIDFNTGKVNIYGYKTKKWRVVMLDKVALGYMRIYLNAYKIKENSDVYLFGNMKNGGKITTSAIRKRMTEISKNSNLDRNLYPHLFRKSCATQIVRRGGSVEDAGAYLGHAEQSVTGKHYVYRDDTYIEKIFNNYVAIV